MKRFLPVVVAGVFSVATELCFAASMPGGCVSANNWRPSFTPRGFNLQGMRMAGPKVGFREEYFKWIADWGFNFVRLPLDYRCWVKDMKSENREIIEESGLKLLDEGIAYARKYGLVTMICLHRIPGEYSVKVRDPEPGNIYTDDDCLRAAVMHWSMLARRYKNIPREELFFNLINEPSSQAGTMEQYVRVCRVLIDAIRKEDPQRFIVADGWAGGLKPVPGLYDIPGVGQATRGYYPYWFSHFGVNTQAAMSAEVAPICPPKWPPTKGRPDGRIGGPKWDGWHEPFVLHNAPAADYRLALATVSGPVRISIKADGTEVVAISLEPKENDSEWVGIQKIKNWALRGTPRKPIEFKLGKPAGNLSVQVVEGDWATPRALVAEASDGRMARLDFGGDMKVKKNIAWERRFAGWDKEEPMPPLMVQQDQVPKSGGQKAIHSAFADEGMAAIIAGPLGEWEDALKKGVWCMVGEFGCANHTSQADSLRFMESNLRLFDKLGMGWCCWGFIGSRFGILNSGRADVDYENWHGMKLDRRMLEVLQRHSAGAVRPIAALAENRQSGGHLENENKAYGALHESIVERVVLWPKLAPHETKSDSGRYAYDSKRKVWRRYDVSQPELVILKPKGVPRDTMVVVMPGGGYYSQHLGHICRDSRPILESSRWVAVLHYRIPRRKGRRIYDAPREDAARAIRLLRANANRFGCSPEKIGAVGFSAGAHLAAISAVSSQDALYDRIDDIDDISAHLNFAVPVYPAYVADDGAMGPNARGGDGAAILPEFKFDKKTPPMFMLHGDRDNYSPMASVLLYTELHRRKIPAQLFVYANVAHGLGDTVNAKGWQNRIVDWMESIGF